MIHGAIEDGDLEMLPLFEGEPMSVFLPVSHRLAESDAIGPDDVESETLVLVPRAVDPGLHARLVSELREAGYAFDRVMETVGGDPRDVLFAVAEGFGITVGPRSTLKRFADMASVVAGRPLAGDPRMPETVVALSGQPHAGKGPGLAAVRAAARGLSGLR
jgi:DNA-binding transcriptional LysR family regulator